MGIAGQTSTGMGVGDDGYSWPDWNGSGGWV